MGGVKQQPINDINLPPVLLRAHLRVGLCAVAGLSLLQLLSVLYTSVWFLNLIKPWWFPSPAFGCDEWNRFRHSLSQSRPPAWLWQQHPDLQEQTWTSSIRSLVMLVSLNSSISLFQISPPALVASRRQMGRSSGWVTVSKKVAYCETATSLGSWLT